jgi:hypothetical protein
LNPVCCQATVTLNEAKRGPARRAGSEAAVLNQHWYQSVLPAAVRVARGCFNTAAALRVLPAQHDGMRELGITAPMMAARGA